MEFESTDAMRKKVDSFTYKPQISSFGHVLKVGDGIFWADGLEGLQLSELVELPGEIYGMALSLSENYNGIALLNGEYDHQSAGPQCALLLCCHRAKDQHREKRYGRIGAS